MKPKKQTRHLSMLCDMGEMFAVLASSTDVPTFLQRTVEVTAAHFDADVCSVYLYDLSRGVLVLKATKGLKLESVGRVTLKPEEGLVGKAFKELRPIRVDRASEHPAYRHFPEAEEDPFESFLAVPIQRGVERVGVLVVQRRAERPFRESDIMALRVLTSQLVVALENARGLIDLKAARTGDEEAADTVCRVVTGTPVVPGYAVGPAAIVRRNRYATIIKKAEDAPVRTTAESDVREAFHKTGIQLAELQKSVESRVPEAASMIFVAHQMILTDPAFMREVLDKVAEGMSAEAALIRTAGKYISTFEASSHDYMRQKAADIQDLTIRLLQALKAVEDHHDIELGGRVVVTRELFPSDLLRLAVENVTGIILVGGGSTSHVVILARSLQIPLVIANDQELLRLPDDIPMLVDAHTGTIHVNPDRDAVCAIEQRRQQMEAVPASHMKERTATADGVRVTLLANINLISELSLAKELKAEGIGLYRTEFPFLVRQAFVSEEEQTRIYSRLFEQMNGREVTIRTLDVGGDKTLGFFDEAGENNPDLGLRSVRFTLRHREVFEEQVRAIMRASEKAVRIMFPMISSVDEFQKCRSLVAKCHAELCSESGQQVPAPVLGTMVEVPSIQNIIGALAKEAEFFSIGTNDFVQYLLAADRTNSRVSEYYCQHHPAVLRGLEAIVGSLVQVTNDVSVCGEMGHEPAYIPFLLGIGVRKFSVDPHFLPVVQDLLSNITLKAAETYALQLLKADTIAETTALLRTDW